MRLRLDTHPSGLLEKVQALAPRAVWAADELVVPGAAATRPAVLDLVRSAGVSIRGLTAEDGRLDSLYQELVAAPGEHR